MKFLAKGFSRSGFGILNSENPENPKKIFGSATTFFGIS